MGEKILFVEGPSEEINHEFVYAEGQFLFLEEQVGQAASPAFQGRFSSVLSHFFFYFFGVFPLPLEY